MSYARKIIQVSFTLGEGNGNFAGTSSNTLTVSGLRTQLTCLETPGAKTNVMLTIFGLTPSHMNQISTYGPLPRTVNFNKMQVSVGDAGSLLTLFFSGYIITANANYNRMPDVTLVITAIAAGYYAVAPVTPLSFRGPVAVATIFNNIATQMGMTLENSGVTTILQNQYLSGSLVDMLKTVARAANINALIDTARNCIAIWPVNGSRNGLVPLVSPSTNMVGYPEFGQGTCLIETEYNPAIVCGRNIKVQSSLQPACGTYQVQQIESNLVTETPGAPWFQRLLAFRLP